MSCLCVYCKNDHHFSFPQDLMDRLMDGNVVIFAGSGISTENPDQSDATFYEHIRHQLGIEEHLPFPTLMTRFCDRPDGRIKLIAEIKKRLHYFTTFTDFYNQMTRFHKAISPLYMIKDVITTNWDDFFERAAGFDPFVYDNDIPLIETSPRRVIKIHGSITNIGSIVATEEDYQNSYRRLNSGPLGAYLKTLMSTKTVIYVGYSIGDSNYRRLLSKISKMLGPMARHSYFISPHIDEDYLGKLPISLTPIRTDGSYFFEQLRVHLNANLPDGTKIAEEEVFDDCEEILDQLIEIHAETVENWFQHRHPLLIFALSYQDG